MLPAAKKGDLCVHGGQIQTGSPDTTTCGQPAARLFDQHDCKTHPPGFPPWPPGPIVTASSTVYINKLPAARKTDQLICGAPAPPPPGAANPETAAYAVRRADSYHELMKNEHEIAGRDVIKDVKEPDKGETGEEDDPLGVKDAKVPPKASGKGPGTKPYTGPSGSNKAHPAAPPASGPTVAAKETPGAAGKSPIPLPTTQAGDLQAKREHTTATVDLAFSMDLSLGMRFGMGGGAPPMDMIVFIPETVFIG